MQVQCNSCTEAQKTVRAFLSENPPVCVCVCHSLCDERADSMTPDPRIDTRTRNYISLNKGDPPYLDFCLGRAGSFPWLVPSHRRDRGGRGLRNRLLKDREKGVTIGSPCGGQIARLILRCGRPRQGARSKVPPPPGNHYRSEKNVGCQPPIRVRERGGSTLLKLLRTRKRGVFLQRGVPLQKKLPATPPLPSATTTGDPLGSTSRIGFGGPAGSGTGMC